MNSNVVEFRIYDADKQEYKDVIRKMNDNTDGRRYGAITERLEMENYIPQQLIKDTFNLSFDIEEEEWANLDIPKYLLDRILLNIKCTNERENMIKMILNGSLTKKIKKVHLDEMGCYEEIESWFKQISSLNFDGISILGQNIKEDTVLI